MECDKCKGIGKLDWVEAIVGKKDQYDEWGQKSLKLHG